MSGAVAARGAGADSANAAPPVAVSGAPYELANDGSRHTLTLTITNTTAEEISATLAPKKADDGCKITPGAAEVAAHVAAAVKYTLSPGCDLGKHSTNLVLTMTTGDAEIAVPVAADSPDDSAAEFGALWTYLIGAVGAALLLWLTYRKWVNGKWAPETPPQKKVDEDQPAYDKRLLEWTGARRPRQWWSSLVSLDSDWSFSDSWGSNIALAGAAFTALLGTGDVLKEILGKGSEQQVTLAVMSAAISAALIGAAPIGLRIFKKPNDAGNSDRASNTAAGVVMASGLVLAATIGQIVVMTVVLHDSEVINPIVLGVAMSAAMVAMGAYTVQTVPLTLTEGNQPPDDAPDPVAAAIDRVALALLKTAPRAPTEGETPQDQDIDAGYPTTTAALAALLPTSTGDDYEPSRQRRRRSAML